jgi:glutathione S-transferase
MADERRLVVLTYSPWSLRARWALEHHGLSYELVRHEPFLGERKLRRIVGNGPTRATVPVLVSREGVITESWDIARYADEHGSGTKLLPDEHVAAIGELTSVANAAMEYGRALIVRALLESDRALEEQLPGYVPAWARPSLRFVARYGTTWFGRKYAANTADSETPRQALRSALRTFRERLHGRPYLFGAFTYADIVLCSILQSIRPPDERYLRLGPASRSVWTQPELAREFEDLLAWRDALYETERAPRAARRVSGDQAA